MAASTRPGGRSASKAELETEDAADGVHVFPAERAQPPMQAALAGRGDLVGHGFAALAGDRDGEFFGMAGL
jgi:hypothetical protein